MLQLPNYNLLKNMQEHISKRLNNNRMIQAQAGFLVFTLTQKSCDSDNRFSCSVKHSFFTEQLTPPFFWEVVFQLVKCYFDVLL